jgi:hypothetical protein
MLFSISGFESGAIEYAEAHGIALVQFAEGKTTWLAKGADASTVPPPWIRLTAYVGWWHHSKYSTVLSEDSAQCTRQALGIEPLTH